MRTLKQALSYTLKCARCLGWGSIVYFYAWFAPGLYRIKLRGLDLYFRGKTSDMKCIYQIFVEDQYPALDMPSSPNVIDLGAYAGYFAMLTHIRHPSSRICCVEPDAENFELLQKNVGDLPGVTCIRAAAGGSAGAVRAVNPNSPHWARKFSPGDGDGGDIEQVTIPDLMDRSGFDTLDILKIDIEGAEGELIGSASDWLHHVRFMIIEIHPNQWKAVFEGLTEYDYSSALRGENIVLGLSDAPVPRSR